MNIAEFLSVARPARVKAGDVSPRQEADYLERFADALNDAYGIFDTQPDEADPRMAKLIALSRDEHEAVARLYREEHGVDLDEEGEDL